MVLTVLASKGSLSFFLSRTVPLIDLLFYLLAFSYFLIYILKRQRLQTRRGARYSAALHVAFAACVILFLSSIIVDRTVTLMSILAIARTLDYLGVFFLLFLLLFFLIFMAAYFLRAKRNYKPALVLLAIVFVVLLLAYSLRFLVQSYSVDDEQIMVLESVRLMLNGTNPYTVSIAELIYSNRTPTLTASNKIVGTLDYPALFFLSFVPFYFLSPPTLQNLTHIDMGVQATAFIFILILALGLLIRKEELLKLHLTLTAAFVFMLTYIASITTYLMLALILLAYVLIDSAYAWLLLGLCLSIQEQLWLPVIFLFAYSLNRHGIKRGIYNILGAVVVFLVINEFCFQHFIYYIRDI